jgi:hypothetical protein
MEEIIRVSSPLRIEYRGAFGRGYNVIIESSILNSDIASLTPGPYSVWKMDFFSFPPLVK